MIPLKENEIRAILLVFAVAFLASAIRKIDRSGFYWEPPR